MQRADFKSRVHVIIANAVTPNAVVRITADGRIIATPSLTVNDVDGAMDVLFDEVTADQEPEPSGQSENWRE